MVGTSIYLTVFETVSGTLNKTISVEDGSLHKSSSAHMKAGFASKYKFDNQNPFQNLEFLCDELTSTKALGLGIADQDNIEIFSKYDFPNEKHRTKEYFKFHDQKTFFYIDIDDSEYSLDETLDIFFDVLPEFKDKTYYKRASSSANIKGYEKDSYHLYFLADSGLSIPRLNRIIQSRLWCAGHGCIKYSSVGHSHVRNKLGIDCAVFASERLIFEAQATLQDGLQRNDAINTIIEGSDNIVQISKLSADDRFVDLVKNAKQSGHDESIKITKQYAKKHNLTSQTVDTLQRGILPRDLVLNFDDGRQVKIKDLDESFDHLTLICPFDDKQRHHTAILYWNDGYSNSRIYSYKTDTAYRIQEQIVRRKAFKQDSTEDTFPQRVSTSDVQILNSEGIDDFLNGIVENVFISPESGSGKTFSLAEKVFQYFQSVRLDIYFKDK